MELSNQTQGRALPADWHTPAIRQVCQLVNGRGFKPHEWRRRGLPIIRIQNLNGSDEFNYYEGPFDRKIEVDPGQLLFAWSGSRGTSFGPHIWNGPRGVLNYHTWKVVVADDAIDTGFFFHALRKLTAFIEEKAHGASALVHTQKWEMEGFVFPAPRDFREQQAIAHALSDVDDLIQSLERLIEKKRGLKQAAMQQLLTGQTRLPGFSGEWIDKRLSDLTDCTAGGTPSTRRPDFWGGTIRWMSSGDLHMKRVYEVPGRITISGLTNSSSKMLPERCVLIGLAGQGKTRGTVAINYVPLSTNQSIGAIFPSEHIDAEFLFHNLDSRYEELRELSAGDGGRGGLNLRLIRSLPISLPPIDEQAGIAEALTDMDAEITALEARLTKTRDLKQGMMQELLTGRTRLV